MAPDVPEALGVREGWGGDETVGNRTESVDSRVTLEAPAIATIRGARDACPVRSVPVDCAVPIERFAPVERSAGGIFTVTWSRRSRARSPSEQRRRWPPGLAVHSFGWAAQDRGRSATSLRAVERATPPLVLTSTS